MVRRAHVNTTELSVAAQSTGVMARGTRVPVVLVANCVGSLIPLDRRTVTEPNFPTHLCWYQRSPVFGE